MRTRHVIPVTKPYFGPEELDAVQAPLRSGWVVQGPFVASFERTFSEFTGAPFCVATSSCTTALHVALAALGVKAGDEVIVPAFTWVSTANVVEYQGATPVFCDIDLETFNLDPRSLASLITPRTVGVVPVHLFGLCADMAPVLEAAGAAGLWVVEDAACAFGAYYRGRHAGTLGDAGCFSFHPRKAITTGEGGMLTTRRESLSVLARSLRDHGSSRSDLERHVEGSGVLPSFDRLGYNYRMTDIQGSLGCAQMKRAAWLLAERSRRAASYDHMLAGLDWLRTPAAPDGYVHGYQSYVCLLREDGDRDALILELGARGVSTVPGTHAPVGLGYYRERYRLRPERFPNAHAAGRLSLALPLYPQMTDEEQETVVTELRKAFEDVRDRRRV